MKKSFWTIVLVLSYNILLGQISYSSFQEGKVIHLTFKKFAEWDSSYSGTGFCIKTGNSLYIITNRHLVKEGYYYLKNSYDYYYRFLEYRAIDTNDIDIYRKTKRVNIYGDSLFYGTSYHNKPIDIVAIPVSSFSKKDLMQPVDFTPNFDLEANDEVFYISIIERDNHFFHFISFAKVLSNPKLPYTDPTRGEIPAFLIDKPTMHGTSGSPVFIWKDKVKMPILVGIVADNTEDGKGVIWKREGITKLISTLPK